MEQVADQAAEEQMVALAVLVRQGKDTLEEVHLVTLVVAVAAQVK
jgi:hypothetical protein